MKKLEYTISKAESNPNVTIINFSGAFDGSAKEQLAEIEQTVQNIQESGVMVFNFADLEYLNSYAIGQLVAWQNHVKKKQGQIMIAAPSKNVEDILSILGITALFKIFPEVQSAVGSLTQG